MQSSGTSTTSEPSNTSTEPATPSILARLAKKVGRPVDHVRIVAAAGLGAAALVLSGCSDPEAASTSGGGNEESGAESIRIALTPTGVFFPVYLAEGLGEFDNENLDVEFIETPGGAEATTALISGSAEFAAKSMDSIPVQLEQPGGADNPIRAVVGLQANPTFSVITSTELGIEPGDTDALLGLQLGITSPGSGTDQGLRAYLNAVGIDPESDVALVATGGVAEMVPALASGSVDGFFAGEPAALLAVNQGIGEQFIDYREAGPQQLREVAFTALQATDAYAEENPEIVERAVRAIVRAEERFREDPSLGVEIAQETFASNVDPEVLAEWLELDAPFMRPGITENEVQNLLATLDGAELIEDPAAFAYDDIVATEFSDLWE